MALGGRSRGHTSEGRGTMRVAQRRTKFEAGGLRLNSEHCPARVLGGAEDSPSWTACRRWSPRSPAEVGGWEGQGLGAPRFSLTGVCVQTGCSGQRVSKWGQQWAKRMGLKSSHHKKKIVAICGDGC